jgi:hypothetical protein
VIFPVCLNDGRSAPPIKKISILLAYIAVPDGVAQLYPMTGVRIMRLQSTGD